MRMLCALLELRSACVFVKRQIPQLYPVIRLIRHRKSLIFEVLRIGKERFLLRRGQNAQPFSTLFFAVFDAGIQQIRGIPVSLERSGHPQTINVSIAFRVNRNPGILRRNVLDKALAPLCAFKENKSLIKSVRKPRLL